MHTIWEINILGGVFMLYGFYFDPTYILIIIGMVICMAASAHVNSTFKKYSRYRSNSGLTGAQAAAKILESQGIYDVQIRHVSGDLTDNYNPSNKVLSLSDATYNSTSVAAIGVAAHECGHAMQHQKGYTPIAVRNALVPFANWGARIVLGTYNCRINILWTGNRTDNNKYRYFCLFIGSNISDSNSSCRV